MMSTPTPETRLSAAIADARISRHYQPPAVPPELAERIRLLRGLLKMCRSHIFRAIYCDDCETKLGVFIDGVVGAPMPTAGSGPFVQFVPWNKVALIVAEFEGQAEKKPPAAELGRTKLAKGKRR